MPVLFVLNQRDGFKWAKPNNNPTPTIYEGCNTSPPTYEMDFLPLNFLK
jgi:hypothetical protein